MKNKISVPTCAALLLLILVLAANASAREHHPGLVLDVKDFGAIGDRRASDTAAVQSAIDSANKAGGGTVRFPAGTYLCGTLYLKSNVELFLEEDSIILGDVDLAQYPLNYFSFQSLTQTYGNRALIYSEKQRNIAIRGQGTIDGQGAAFPGTNVKYEGRPYPIRMIECQNVTLEDVTLRDGALWTVHFLACDNVVVRGLTINSFVNRNNDGIDVDSSHDILIEDCDIRTGDDAVCLKSTSFRKTKNVIVRNCVLQSHCNGFKMGTETNGGFENVLAHDLVIKNTRQSALALEIVDGGRLHNVRISDVRIDGAGCPLFIRLGNRGRPPVKGMDRPEVGTVAEIQISNVHAKGLTSFPVVISGIPRHAINDVVIRDCSFSFAGGGKKMPFPGAVPEVPWIYPEFDHFGPLPAYGVYCRHAQGITIENVQVSFVDPDPRPAFVFDEVRDLSVAGAKAASIKGTPYVAGVLRTQNAKFSNCETSGAAPLFLRLLGAKNSNVEVMAPVLPAGMKPSQ